LVGQIKALAICLGLGNRFCNVRNHWFVVTSLRTGFWV
jgi:hypothetical protein